MRHTAIRLFRICAWALSVSGLVCATAANAAGLVTSSAYNAIATCTAPGKATVEKYLQALLPDVGATLISAGFIENFRDQLLASPTLKAKWEASPARQDVVLDALETQAFSLQQEARTVLMLHMAQVSWQDAFDVRCDEFTNFAIRMSQRDAQDYIALERQTLKASLLMGVQGVPVWLELADDAARQSALADAATTAKGMPAYPFGFEGRTSFNALAVAGLTKGRDDSKLRPWMADVRRVLGKGGNTYLKSPEAARLRKGVMAEVDPLVRSTFQGAERDKLKASFSAHMSQVLAALNK